MSKEKKRFENFMYLDLNKGPGGSCQWISAVMADSSLTYEEIGLLLVLGEELGGSSFSIEHAFTLRPTDLVSGKWFPQMFCNLVSKGYISENWCKDGTTEEDKRDYFAYVMENLKNA